ncbi:hypothetical protein KW803_03405 [Candidatus Saccharibacteria bacterium]|nr:hypothetical protein [Candidatus Saccharibacteria bacterium]
MSIVLSHYGQSYNPVASSCNLYSQPDGTDLSQTGSGSATVKADVNNPTTGRIYSPGQSVTMNFTTNSANVDTLAYQVCNFQDKQVSSGEFAVPSGSYSKQVTWVPTQSGYFAIKAMLKTSKQFLPQVGSRPQGISTFGVLPNTTSWTGFSASQTSSDDQYRFGVQGTNAIQSGHCCDGDMFQPLYNELGIKWVNVGAYSWINKQPNSSTVWNPITNPTQIQPTAESNSSLKPYYTLNGIPGWANQSGQDSSKYPPNDFSAYQAYMKKVGQEVAATRQALYPNMQYDYYQITWEPETGTGTNWLGTDAQFAQLYQNAWLGLHAGDPQAIVLGPTYGSVACNTQTGTTIGGCGGLTKLSQIGATQYMDGLSSHGYWYSWTPPESWPPDTGNSNPPLPFTMRRVRSQMAQFMKPSAQRLFMTETGIGYPQAYAKNYPNLLDMQKQGAWLIRGNITELGEGADFNFPFYTADYSGEKGFGMNFNLDMANQDFGSGQISPKISGMGLTTATRLLDGTYSLGYLNNMDSFDGIKAGGLGYVFQSRSSNQVITSLWAWGGGAGPTAPFNGNSTYNLHVGAAGTSGNVTVLDFMGNAKTMPFSNGQISLVLSEYPIYVISSDPTAIKAFVTAPQGYQK